MKVPSGKVIFVGVPKGYIVILNFKERPTPKPIDKRERKTIVAIRTIFWNLVKWQPLTGYSSCRLSMGLAYGLFSI